MDFAELRRRAVEFGNHLVEVKASTTPPSVGWYPPMLPRHIDNLDRLLVGDARRLLEEPSGRPIADLGAADGDFGFFLASVGFDVDLFDGANRPQLLKEPLGSTASLHFVDLDHDFELPRTYEVVFLLHVVYHLRNPMLALDTLAGSTQYCVLSTRVANHVRHGRVPRRRTKVQHAPVAYLLDPFELNPHDAHSYWIFTEVGLRRLVTRCGWEVQGWFAGGNPRATPDAQDQPIVWCLLRSERFSSRVVDG